ncbi:MAG: xanthine dehydrogenase family protein molybdopterin-binding subunit [Myxococcota bacterium]|nr:xanthine dehydrogenase family protein molybdopterin-binding subunit [Myxococcota bacterium]
MNTSRRGFLKASAAGAAGLVISFYVPNTARAVPEQAKPLPQPNAFVQIDKDSTVTVVLAHSEMGQGIWTGLAMLIAEELEADWSKVKSTHAPAAQVYGHPAMGMQMTGGSTSTWAEFERYRQVGAMAKDMLVRAAAAKWKVPAAKIKVANGVLTSGKNTAPFGELAEDAMKLPPPKTVKLKDPREWKLIGKPTKRLDTPEKINGTAKFGMDVQFAGLHTAVVARPPAFGAKLGKFDASAALKVPGVVKVVPTGTGVAVVAKHFWAAKLGRDKLVIEWTQPDGGGADTNKLMAEWRTLSQKPGALVEEHGKIGDALTAAKKKYDVTYEFPYLAHAPMEPLNCTVKIDGDKCEIWTGTQFQTMDQLVASKILGTSPDKVTINTLFLGGGFGRRATPTSDFVSEAVIVAKAAGLPVKTVWTREDDIRGGYYRPAYVHRVQVGTDDKGTPTAWDHVVVGQSIAAGTPFEAFIVKNGIDGTSVEGLAECAYFDKKNLARRITLHSPKTAIPVLWWRSVGATHIAFALECMIDELAHAAGKDPLDYRLALLAKEPRHATVLKTCAEKAGWGTPPAAGRARGLALHESFGSIIAECAEVSIENKQVRVHAVTAAVDCGTAVNPLAVEAQVQSCIAFGLTATLYGKLTLAEGKVQQSNFHDYQIVRMHEMPKVSVHIIPSKARMGGIGEPATAPIAPAVANAVFALTKQRIRSLPLKIA